MSARSLQATVLEGSIIQHERGKQILHLQQNSGAHANRRHCSVEIKDGCSDPELIKGRRIGSILNVIPIHLQLCWDT